MLHKSLILAAGLAALMAVPVEAAGLLGRLGGGGGGDGLVNVDIGGDHLVHVSTGGGLAPTVGADVKLLGNDGGLANVGLSVGNGGIGACVSVLSNGCGTSGGPGGPGPGKTGVKPGAGGGAFGTAGRGGVCASLDDQRAVELMGNRYDDAVFSGWAKARQIKLVLVKPCPSLRAKLQDTIKGSRHLQQMQQAAASDALIAATLSRNGVRARNVLGVDGKGAALSVYIY